SINQDYEFFIDDHFRNPNLEITFLYSGDTSCFGRYQLSNLLNTGCQWHILPNMTFDPDLVLPISL
ncbi:hypothetical protein X975_23352, partial [Stegodyphus mimosarum]